MSIKEVVLNPDRTLNILDTEKFYFLVAKFPGNIGSDSIQIYIVQQDPDNKYYGFIRVVAIENNKIKTSHDSNFRNIYLQYSVQDLLLFEADYYTKHVYECNSQQEFVKFCNDNPAIEQILVKSQGSD